MGKVRKEKLIELGVDVLADTILTLASMSKRIDNMVDKLLVSEKTKVRLFKERLSQFEELPDKLNYDEREELITMLANFIQDLKISHLKPEEALKLIAMFYEYDKVIYPLYGEYDNNLNTIFLHEAQKLFIDYASRCSDKELVCKIFTDLIVDDDYSVRYTLIEHAYSFLFIEDLKKIITTLQKKVKKLEGLNHRYDFYNAIKSLAKQVKDTNLFEEMALLVYPDSYNYLAFMEIAKVYLDNKEIQKAYNFIVKIPKERFNDECEKILIEIYENMGKKEELTSLLITRLRKNYSKSDYKALLKVVNPTQRDAIVQTEIDFIFANPVFEAKKAQFLISIDKSKEADDYLLNRATQLNGNDYFSLLPLAESLEENENFLAASLIYRSLIIAILERGNSKAYHHGVDYLHKLDELDRYIPDWKKFKDHFYFKEAIHTEYRRKHSFWSNYKN